VALPRNSSGAAPAAIDTPAPSSAEAKAAIRGRIRAARTQGTASQRETESARVCQELERQNIWQQAGSVLFYAPLPDEVDVWPLVLRARADKKLVALPRFDALGEVYRARLVLEPDQDVVPGRFGIREPCDRCPESPLSAFDLVLVPGLAFDRHGYRLGRGYGFYDRLLVEVRGIKCGVAFELESELEIPAERHDIAMDFVVTPNKTLDVRSLRNLE
jgi:5-formyltetrahydrofolate cyclo-ligase